jgi:hypothetical protein
MCVGIRVIEHHGASRTTGQIFSPAYILRKSDDPEIDPAKLKQAHVVVTSDSIVASEHGIFKPDAKNKAKAKAKSKATKKQETSDSEDFSKTLGVKKKKPASKKQVKDVLFHVKWFRIVLGGFSSTFPVAWR